MDWLHRLPAVGSVMDDFFHGQLGEERPHEQIEEQQGGDQHPPRPSRGRHVGTSEFVAAAWATGGVLPDLGLAERAGDRRLVIVVDGRITIVAPVVDILLKLVISIEVVSVAGHGSCKREGVRERQRGSLLVAPYVGRCR